MSNAHDTQTGAVDLRHILILKVNPQKVMLTLGKLN